MSHTRFKVNPHSIFFLNVAPVSSKAFLDIQTTIKCGLTLERVRDIRGECRASETSKMEHFVIIINSFQPLAIIMDRSTLDVAAALDLPPHLQFLRKEFFNLIVSNFSIVLFS